MEAVDPHVEAAVLWLAQTILEVLFAGGMEEWIRQVGLAYDTERLKSEIERVEAVLAAVKRRAAANRPLPRSPGRLKELLYDADDMVDELDYYRLQHQVQGGMCVDVDVDVLCSLHSTYRCLYDDSKGKLLADTINFRILFPFCLAQVRLLWIISPKAWI